MEDFERIGEEVRAQREAMTKAPGTHLPVVIVESQVELAKLSRMELQRRMIDAAVALAIQTGGAMTPRKCLEVAADTVGRLNWDEVGAEVRKVLHRAFPERDEVAS